VTFILVDSRFVWSRQTFDFIESLLRCVKGILSIMNQNLDHGDFVYISVIGEARDESVQLF